MQRDSKEITGIEVLAQPLSQLDRVARVIESIGAGVAAACDAIDDSDAASTNLEDFADGLVQIYEKVNLGLAAVLGVSIEPALADQAPVSAAGLVRAERREQRGQLVNPTGRIVRGQQDRRALRLTHDAKVSPEGYYQESNQRWVAITPNSFGLPSRDTCPGLTSFCDVCYATNAEKRSSTRELLEANYNILKDQDVDGMTESLRIMIGEFSAEATRRKLAPEDRIFRIHWSGDFFSEEYAEAWKRVVAEFPEIEFWTYTRSFHGKVNVVPILADVENLSLYLSADVDNIDLALFMASEYPSVKIAYSGRDQKSARRMATASGRPSAITCPENAGTVDLMTDGRGACVTCRACIRCESDIIFYGNSVQGIRVELQAANS